MYLHIARRALWMPEANCVRLLVSFAWLMASWSCLHCKVMLSWNVRCWVPGDMALNREGGGYSPSDMALIDSHPGCGAIQCYCFYGVLRLPLLWALHCRVCPGQQAPHLCARGNLDALNAKWQAWRTLSKLHCNRSWQASCYIGTSLPKLFRQGRNRCHRNQLLSGYL